MREGFTVPEDERKTERGREGGREREIERDRGGWREKILSTNVHTHEFPYNREGRRRRAKGGGEMNNNNKKPTTKKLLFGPDSGSREGEKLNNGWLRRHFYTHGVRIKHSSLSMVIRSSQLFTQLFPVQGAA